MTKINGLQEMANFTFTTKYAKYDEKKKRREVWSETVDRVEKMHLKKFNFLSADDKKEIKSAFDLVREKMVVPSMRSLQFGGKAIEQHNMRMFNCLGKNTQFLTKNGVKSFVDFKDGDQVMVLTHNSNWKNATVRYYGKNNLYPILISGKNATETVLATSDHRWILTNGTITTSLKVGDAILSMEGDPRIVKSIGAPTYDDTWCLVVPDDQSFVLSSGLVTGNCSVTHVHSIRSFAESFYALLCGTGVGFGITYKFLDRLPDLVTAKNKTGTVLTYVIQDSIEGWADSVEALLNCYMKNTPYTGRKIVFDYSKIRPKGAPLKTGGGKAPGYKGLKKCHKKIKDLLDNIIEEKGQTRLKTIDAYDILMHCADAVLSGGIRRSACSVIFDADDEDMMNAKTGNWFVDNPQRGRSNNSAIILRNKTNFESFKKLIQRTKEFGEPGFLYVIDDRQLLNPSLRKGTKVITRRGIFPIEELEGQKNLAVKNFFGKWSPAECTLSGRDQLLYKITLENGIEYFATEQHKWPIVTPTGVSRKQTDQLEPQDKVYALRTFGLNYGKDGEYEDGLLAGWINGGDWVTKEETNKFKFSFGFHDRVDHMILNKLQNLLDTDLEPKANVEDSIVKSVEIDRELLTPFFGKFYNENADIDQGLPEKIWVICSDKFIRGYVDGIFSSNGVCENNELKLVSGNEKLVGDLQRLLGFFGITSFVAFVPAQDNTHKNQWILSIKNLDDIKHFNCVFSIQDDEISKELKNIPGINKKYPLSKSLYIKSIEKTELREDVWDISVYDDSHCFQLDNCITGNCFEISFIPVTEDGRCGFQMCNLTSINGAKIDTFEKYKIAAKAAALIGTLQAAYTDFEYLGKTSEELTKEEALLGVSVTGWMDNPVVLLNEEHQRIAAKIVVETNKQWAAKINVSPSARTTCVKPEGSTSVVLCSASGIHPHHARKYFRRIQMNKEDNVYNFFKIYNPHACEESVWSANKTDDVITFPIEIPPTAMVKADLTALKHLEIIKSVQANWVNHGTTEANKKPLVHSVSCTVIVKDSEWEEVTKYLYDNQDYFTAVSLLPETGDKIYKQAPMEAIVTEEDEAKWNLLVKNWEPVDFSKLEEIDDATNHVAEAACAGGKCEVTKL